MCFDLVDFSLMKCEYHHVYSILVIRPTKSVRNVPDGLQNVPDGLQNVPDGLQDVVVLSSDRQFLTKSQSLCRLNQNGLGHERCFRTAGEGQVPVSVGQVVDGEVQEALLLPAQHQHRLQLFCTGLQVEHVTATVTATASTLTMLRRVFAVLS